MRRRLRLDLAGGTGKPPPLFRRNAPLAAASRKKRRVVASALLACFQRVSQALQRRNNSFRRRYALATCFPVACHAGRGRVPTTENDPSLAPPRDGSLFHPHNQGAILRRYSCVATVGQRGGYQALVRYITNQGHKPEAVNLKLLFPEQ